MGGWVGGWVGRTFGSEREEAEDLPRAEIDVIDKDHSIEWEGLSGWVGGWVGGWVSGWEEGMRGEESSRERWV